MADDGQDYRPRGSLDFVESSTLDTIIPINLLDIDEVLVGSGKRLGEGASSPLASIACRQNLFFDETINVYIVLQTPYFEKTALRSYLARLVVSVEARVINSSPEAGGPLNHETIFSGSVADSDDPHIIFQNSDGNEEGEKEGRILILWRLSVILCRPTRLRLQNPSVVFSSTASLKPADQVQLEIIKAEYLPSQVPSGLNLLESFKTDPALNKVKPSLSALRVSRVVPATQFAADFLRPLKNISRQTKRILPAFGVRVRYTKPNRTPSSPAIIASLDVDITPFAGLEVTLESVELRVTEGLVEDLSNSQGMALPMSCLPRDDITFLYRLLPDELDSNKLSNKAVHIAIRARVKVFNSCESQISMHWQTSVDFTLPVNPGFGHPSQAIRRDHRPSQLSINSTADSETTAATLALTRPDALPSMEPIIRHQRSTSIPDFGVTMTFTSLSTSPVPGEPFSWEVFIVNRSDRPRKLALIAIPHRRRSERLNTTRPPSASYGRRKDFDVADAVLDENILYAMQKNSAVEPAEIICYNSDNRVGPLAPSACHTVELRFMALTSGILGLEAVRVVDLGTQEHVDIRDLPSIIVAPTHI